jgi:lipoyl(octanoyl) transferase
MESAIVAALAEIGVEARGRPEDGPDYTGVWVEDRKIASIGVHVARGVSAHGFAVNVDNDLEPFSWVVACGLPDVQMTSLAEELGQADAPTLDRFSALMAGSFSAVHGRTPVEVPPSQLGIEAPLRGRIAA